MKAPTTSMTITRPRFRPIAALLTALLLAVPSGCTGADADTAAASEDDQLPAVTEVHSAVTLLPDCARARPSTYC